MKELNKFVTTIKDFTKLNKSLQIDYFSFFLIEVKQYSGITTNDILLCFEELNLPSYSNVSQYLKNNSTRSKKAKQKFIVKNGKYYLTSNTSESILKIVGNKKTIEPTDNLFPLELFTDARTYIYKIALQASIAYDYGLYDASNVMLRRLLETLIIETYERKKIAHEITDKSGNFYFLRDLIEKLKINDVINLSRNSKQSLKELKSLGDLSAHSRRFIAMKSDVDEKKDSLRIVIEELLHVIDYPNWKDN